MSEGERESLNMKNWPHENDGRVMSSIVCSILFMFCTHFAFIITKGQDGMTNMRCPLRFEFI